MSRGLPAVAAALVLLLVGCGGDDDSGPTSRPTDGSGSAFVAGAVDDAARHPGPVLGQLADAGFGALGLTSFWEPGLSAPASDELAVLRDTASRADERDLRVFLSVYHRGSSTTPLTPSAREEFAAYVAALVRDVPQIRDVIVGNEPNLNRFWLPQYGPDGANVASAAYLELLAQVYDAAKSASEDVLVWGGAIGPRGSDRPEGIRHTQSPTAFIRGMGDALRGSGRTDPPMDGFAFHPYPASSSTPPDVAHPDPRSKTIGLADIGRLQDALRQAFGRALPILYSELGVESEIPASKRALYEGEEVASPVDEETQADFYRRALELAACQEGVVGLLLFHSHDEPALTGFQSGVYYVDGTPKTSLPAVREAIAAARDGC
ncbi:MAG TPA: hypothetical protein VNP93_14910 [Gaiellaceae bacterium]|nr:hypothetical protein [Gaiellaceae bacterium]